MSRMDRETANAIYNALKNREPFDAKIRELKKQIEKENAELQALAKKGIKFDSKVVVSSILCFFACQHVRIRDNGICTIDTIYKRHFLCSYKIHNRASWRAS